MSTLINHRYRVVRELGKGGMGDVILVEDTLYADQQLALKTIRADLLTEQSLVQFKDEFAALAQLQHPNLVKVYDFGVVAATQDYFFTMEYVPGVDWATFAARQREEAADLTWLYAIIVQVCRALQYIHARGFIHYDVKPRNVLILPDGHVKLMDFGLIGQAHGAQSIQARGTPEYIAPELIKGDPVDHRVDLYSLGVSLYEVAVGVLPFEDDSSTTVFRQHVEVSPTFPPSVGALSPDLQTLILKLMAKHPDDRYRSANAVIEAINRLTGAQFPLETPETQREMVRRSMVVGRASEIARLRGLLTRMQQGDGQVLLVEGAIGAGKTRLMREARLQAQIQRVLVFEGVCHEHGQIPYYPWISIFKQILASSLTFRSLQTSGFALVQLMPDLQSDVAARLPPGVMTEEAVSVPALDNKQALLSAAVDVLVDSDLPILLLLEDLHYADAETLELFEALAQRVHEAHIMLVGTYRGTDMEASHPLMPLIEKAQSSGPDGTAFDQNLDSVDYQILRLTPFDAPTTDVLVRSMLGIQAPEYALPEDFLPWLMQKTGGNPGFVESLVYALVEEGALHYASGTWQVNLAQVSETPANILEATQRRLMYLAEDALSVLQWAAVIGMEVDVPLLSEVSGVQGADLLAVLTEAVERHVLTRIEHRDTPSYHFSSEQMRLAICETLPDEQRELRHARIAEIFRERYAPSEVVERLAWHFDQAGYPEVAWQYARAAGDKARRSYANNSAVQHYTQALEERAACQGACSLDDLYSIYAGREQAYRALGDWQAQKADLEEMARIARDMHDHARQVDVMVRQADLDNRLGNHAEAKHLAEAALALSQQAEDASLEADSLDALGEGCYGLGDLDAAYECHQEALNLSRALENRTKEAHNLWHLGRIARLFGRLQEAQEHLEASLTLFRALGDRAGETDALNTLGNLMHDYAKRRDYHEQSLAIAQLIENQHFQSRAYNNLAVTYWGLGLYNRARQYVEQAVQLERARGGRFVLSYSLETLGRVYLELQEYDLAETAFEEGRALALETGNRAAESFYGIGLGRVMLARDEPETACEWFKSAYDTHKAQHYMGYISTSAAWMGYAYLVQHQWELADRYTKEAVKALEFAEGGEFPAQEVWWRRYQVLQVDPHHAKSMISDAAWAALKNARGAMFEAIATLSDEGLRRNYLNKVVINRDIITEWARQSAARGVEQVLPDLTPDFDVEQAESERLKSKLARVLDISVRMNEMHDAASLFDFVMDQVIELSGAERGFLVLLDESGTFDFKVSLGVDITALQQSKAPVSYTVLGTVMQSRQPVLLQDSRTDERFGDQDSVLELNLLSVLCVPLISRSKVIGMIYADNRSVIGRFSQADLDLMMIFANQAATAIENAHLYEDLFMANQSLEEWAGTLEARVAVRTAEVEAANAALSRRAVQLQTIAQVGQQITSILDRDELLRRVVHLIQAQFSYYFVGVWLVDESHKVLRLSAGTDNMAQKFRQKGIVIPLDAPSVNAGVYHTGKARLVQDVAQISDFWRVEDLPDLASEMVLPLRVGDTILGTLNIGSRQLDRFADDDEVVLQGLADQLAIALRNAQLYELEQRRRQSTELLEQSGRVLTSSLEMSEVPQRILALLNTLVPYERGLVLLRKGQVLTPVAHYGFLDSSHIHELEVSLTEGDVYDQLETARRPLIVGDVTQETGWKQVSWLPLNRSWLGVLLIAKGCAIGMISLTREAANAFDEEDAMWVQAFAAQASVALENARYHEDILRFNEHLELMVRQRTEELRKANEVLARMDKTKSHFIKVAAHELRTPLTAVIGFAQMLNRYTDIEPGSRLEGQVKGIQSGANRMKAVIESMFDVARIESQTLQMIRDDVYLDDLMRRVHIAFVDALRRRAIEFSISGLDDLPTVQGDAKFLHKVFYHLLVNAIKYTPDGGSITISGKQVTLDKDVPAVEIVVADTGIGIDPEDHELIFEKFYQTGDIDFHSSGHVKFKAGGPGLGLAIARGIVEAHQGQIWVESPGHDEEAFPGSRFYVRLPLG